MTKKRLEWIDFLKGIAIICVVFEHACERTAQFLPLNNVWLDMFRMFIKTFQMAIFFTISGYLYSLFENSKIINSDLQSAKRYAKHKTIDLLIPYSIFGVLIWIGKAIFSQWVKYKVSVMDLLCIYIKPISFAWFLYALFLYCILTMILSLIFKEKAIIYQLFISTFLLILTAVLVSAESQLNKVLYYYFFFVLGIVLDKIVIKNTKVLICVGVFLYFILFGIYYNNQNFVILFALLGLIFSSVIIVLFRNEIIFHDNGLINTIMYLGKESIYIYNAFSSRTWC